ncbi:beta-lactamase [Ralstonia solanacearum]|uniref:MBL fold metallo-hydrolase n=1 Tax=Ralstonia solanacearum TaxID=305 RepID=UPI0001D94FDC|nr:MBL fold metallo-hydrolase [Ralstonia solanacearum]OAI64129.1 beta-lactamase [Ralstonia solanacearum]CBJ42477.1 putative beta-lactamase-like, zn-dependent hydrolase protein [Ralstonia solanacearum CFBP2957]
MRLFPALSTPIRTACVAVAAAALLAAAPVVEAQTVTASPASESTPASSPIAQPRAQVPGYYRMALGDEVVTALYDGYIDLPAKTLLGLSTQSIHGLLARMFVSSTSGMQTAVNGYLIDTGSQRILVDTGSGTCFGPTMGGLAGNLRAAGYQPEQIDVVLLTHLHPDHACGLLTPQGQPAYPNAQVYVAAPEAGFWLSEVVAASKPKDMQPFFKMARDAVAPYAAAGRLKPFRPGDEVLPGVRSVIADGHTPGHSGYLFASKGRSLLVWGDVVHSHAVQFPHPEVALEFDVDPKQAVATRRKLFAEAARDKLWVGGAHLPFPGLGHVRKDGKAYAWVPIEYGPLRTDRAD